MSTPHDASASGPRTASAPHNASEPHNASGPHDASGPHGASGPHNASAPDEAQTQAPTAPPESRAESASTPGHPEWQRLSARIIWVDLVISLLSVLPAAAATVILGFDAVRGQIWPLLGLAAFGVLGAFFDVLRWIFTGYRITPTHVELKTGVVWRQHRSIQRDRIRSVDVEAKLRHRLARMRVVNIGAGQQAAAGEAALSLDALSADHARTLQSELLSAAAAPEESAAPQRTPAASTDHTAPTQTTEFAEPTAPTETAEATAPTHVTAPTEPTQPTDHPAPTEPTNHPAPTNHTDHPAPTPAQGREQVLARFEPSWFIFNMFSIWAFVVALAIGGGALWLLGTVGFDLYGFVVGLLDWDAIGWVGTALIALAAAGVIGAVGLGAGYFTDNWNLELARVPGRDGTMLRTRKGLITTREVNRDENRIRGVQISEPLFWRWKGVSDTSVVTTGLDQEATSEPAAILPRGPLTRAVDVAGAVLGTQQNLFRTPLIAHPRSALRRRLWWATLVAAGVAGLLTGLAENGRIGHGFIWIALPVWVVSLWAAVMTYRAMGHRVTGRYLITRSGLLNRATTVLQRDAVSTIAISESVLQRRLQLCTVSTMTAAGDGGYDTPDLSRQEGLAFAHQAAPGLLDPFLTREHR